jgi:hypothetical protein
MRSVGLLVVCLAVLDATQELIDVKGTNLTASALNSSHLPVGFYKEKGVGSEVITGPYVEPSPERIRQILRGMTMMEKISLKACMTCGSTCPFAKNNGCISPKFLKGDCSLENLQTQCSQCNDICHDLLVLFGTPE